MCATWLQDCDWPAVPLPPDDVGDAAVVVGVVQAAPLPKQLAPHPGQLQSWKKFSKSGIKFEIYKTQLTAFDQDANFLHWLT